MIAVDTNILVYAHREDSAWHTAAYESVLRLAEGRATWAIPAPCIHEFVAVVTHPRIYAPPTPLDLALEQVVAWLESPMLQILTESVSYWEILAETARSARVVGAQIHDARIAALCLHHGVEELWTADRDFGRYVKLTTRNPLL